MLWSKVWHKKLLHVWKAVFPCRSQFKTHVTWRLRVDFEDAGGRDPNHAFYIPDTLVPSVCKPARTRWINKAISEAIYHTRIGSVIINFLGESIRGGAERNGSMCCNKLTLITSPRFAQIAYLAIQIIFKFIVAKQIFKGICIIRRYWVIYCAAYH